MPISKIARDNIWRDANSRCGYCLMAAKYVYASMEIDHILPKVAGGSDDEENLWLACPRCNKYKADQTHGVDPKTHETAALFNPRYDKWVEHFRWSEEATEVKGLTACGRATVEALQLNHKNAVEFRRLLISAGWHPPKL